MRQCLNERIGLQIVELGPLGESKYSLFDSGVVCGRRDQRFRSRGRLFESFLLVQVEEKSGRAFWIRERWELTAVAKVRVA
jgi:hypothetical protein